MVETQPVKTGTSLQEFLQKYLVLDIYVFLVSFVMYLTNDIKIDIRWSLAESVN